MANMREDVGSAVVRMDATGKEKEDEVAAGEVLEVQEVEEDNFQQLLQLLEGKTEAWSEAGKSFGAITLQLQDGYRLLNLVDVRIQSMLFDKADSSYEPFQEWNLRVGSGPRGMRRLMQGIGKCRTLRQIDVTVQLFGFYMGRSELEALLSPLQSNPVLDSLTLSGFLSFGDIEHRIYETLGTILQISATLKSLRLFMRHHSDNSTAYHLLASGLQGNDTSALENLSLRCPGTLTVSEVKQVAEMVLSAPRLSDLRLISISYPGDDDGDGIDALANALAVNTSLKSLWLEDVFEGASALLRKTFTGEGSCTNRSIISLVLSGSLKGIGNSLLLLLSSNQSLKDLKWDLRDTRTSYLEFRQIDWHSLGQFFSSNSSLECFRILLPCSSDSLYGVHNLLEAVDKNKACVELYVIDSKVAKNSRAWDSAAQWRPRDEEREDVLSDMKKLVLELHLYHFRAFYEVLPDLGRELNAFSSLHLQMVARPGQRRWTRESEKILMKDFIQALGDTSTLRLLTIDGANGYLWPGGWKKLVDCLHVNTSITHLRLINCDDLDDDAFRQLMGVLRVNLTLKRIRLTGTSWETDGKKALIEEALRRNADQDSYFSIFRSHKLQFQPAKNGRLFLCGSPFAGKTRLRRTMTRALSGTSLLGDKASYGELKAYRWKCSRMTRRCK